MDRINRKSCSREIMFKKLFFLIISLIIISSVFAETIKIKSGKIIEGKIVEKTDEYIKVDIGIDIPITYYLDEVESIEGQPVSISESSGLSLSLNETEQSINRTESYFSSNKYTDDEAGIQLNFPDGWFVIPGKQLAEQMTKDFNEKLSADKFVKAAKGEAGRNETYSSSTNPQAMAKFMDGMKKIGLSLLPIVSAYKYDPETRKGDITNPSIGLHIKESEDDSLEGMKIELQFAAHAVKAKVIEPLQEISKNELKGVMIAIEYPVRLILITELDCGFLKNNKRYGLFFKCKSEDFAKYRLDFQKVIDSLRIKEETTSTIYTNNEYGVSIIGPEEWQMERIEKTIFEQQIKPAIELAEMFGADQNVTEKAKERAWEMTKKDFGWSDTQGDIMYDTVTNVKQLVTYHKPNTPRKNEPHTSISVYAKTIPQNEANKTLREYFEEDINETKQITPDVKVIDEPEEITLNGNKMLRYVSESRLMSYTCKTITYMCIKNNRLYSITASAVPPGDFEEYYEYFQEAINSLKIN